MSSRLDQELTARALARSRTVAARWIGEGRVLVNGRPATKPSCPNARGRSSRPATARRGWITWKGTEIIKGYRSIGASPERAVKRLETRKKSSRIAHERRSMAWRSSGPSPYARNQRRLSCK